MLLLFLKVGVDYEIGWGFRGEGHEQTSLGNILPVIDKEVLEVIWDAKANGRSLDKGVFLFDWDKVSFSNKGFGLESFLAFPGFLDFGADFVVNTGTDTG